MKKSDLYRKWAGVLDMCEGTKVNPCRCVKAEGVGFLVEPLFDALPDIYEFAVAILEDKPVFVGDKVWYTSLNRFIEIKTAIQIELLVRDGQASWQPPKKTFTLNGEELPIPSQAIEGCYPIVINGESVWFFEEGDRNKVCGAIIKLLKDATK